MFRSIPTVAVMLQYFICIPVIVTSFSFRYGITKISITCVDKNLHGIDAFVRPNTSSLQAVAFDDDNNNVAIKDAYYSDAPHKKIPWKDLPKSYYQINVNTNNKLTTSKTLTSIEMFLGRLAMVLALMFFIAETTTGLSVPQQLSLVISNVQI